MDGAAVEEINRLLLYEWMRARKLEPLLEVLLEPRVDFGLRLWAMRAVAKLGGRRRQWRAGSGGNPGASSLRRG